MARRSPLSGTFGSMLRADASHPGNIFGHSPALISSIVRRGVGSQAAADGAVVQGYRPIGFVAGPYAPAGPIRSFPTQGRSFSGTY